MTARRSILYNAFHFSAGQAVALIIGLVTHAFLARVVGPAQYGILGFGVMVVSYFGILATLGTDAWGSREIARDQDRVGEITVQIVLFRLLFGIVAVIAFTILIAAWRPPATVAYVMVIQMAGIFVAALTVDFAFQGLERMAPAARRNMVSALLALIGIQIFMRVEPNILWAAAVFQVAALIAALIMGVEFWRLAGRPGARLDWRSVAHMVRESTPIATTGMVTAVYFSIDVVILGIFRSGTEVGLYVAAGKILAIGLTFTHIFRTVFFPVLARLIGLSEERSTASRRYAEVVLFFGGLVALGGFLLAPEILVIVFGEAYGGAETALRLLMVNLLFAHFVALYQTQLLAWNLQKAQMVIMIAGAVFNLVLNVVFIPRFGIEAAAATTLASSLLVFILAGTSLRRHGFDLHSGLVAGTAAICMVLGAGGFALMNAAALQSVYPLARFALGGAVISALYLGVALLLGTIRPREFLSYIRRVI